MSISDLRIARDENGEWRTEGFQEPIISTFDYMNRVMVNEPASDMRPNQPFFRISPEIGQVNNVGPGTKEFQRNMRRRNNTRMQNNIENYNIK